MEGELGIMMGWLGGREWGVEGKGRGGYVAGTISRHWAIGLDAAAQYLWAALARGCHGIE